MPTASLDPVNDRLDVWSKAQNDASLDPICEVSPYTVVSKVLQQGQQGVTLSLNPSTGQITINGPGNGEGVKVDNLNNLNLNYPQLTAVNTLSNADMFAAYISASGHHRSISYANFAAQLLNGYVTLSQLQSILAGYSTTGTLNNDLSNYVTQSQYSQLNNSGPSFAASIPGWYYHNYGAFLMQWGNATIFGSGFVNFPLTFPNGVFAVCFSSVGNPGSTDFGGVYATNNSGFSINSSAGPLGGQWIAIGH